MAAVVEKFWLCQSCGFVCGLAPGEDPYSDKCLEDTLAAHSKYNASCKYEDGFHLLGVQEFGELIQKKH